MLLGIEYIWDVIPNIWLRFSAFCTIRNSPLHHYRYDCLPSPQTILSEAWVTHSELSESNRRYRFLRCMQHFQDTTLAWSTMWNKGTWNLSSVDNVMTHHNVKKFSPGYTKARVVFNPSEKDLSVVSVNDALLVGHTFQSDVDELVTHFRTLS